ncbi:MAG: hypothetical protein ABI560_18105, partial [Myxococcales bacterium]
MLFSKLLTGRRKSRKPLILVLDNYQQADGDPTWNTLFVGLVQAWTSGAPAGSRIIVTGRYRPPCQLARLVADGRIAVLDSEVLRLDDEELLTLVRVRRDVGRPDQAQSR